MRKLKICHISDLHNLHKELTILPCDVLICSGDISMMGWKHEIESFFSWFRKQTQATYKILVAGNHDLAFDPQRGSNNGIHKPQWLVDLLDNFDDYGTSDINFYLENGLCQIEEVKFWGSPTSAWFHGERWAFNVKPEDSEVLYSTIPLGTDVIITHGPSYSNGDWCENVNGPVGDMVLTKELYRVQPLLHLFGHIHESYGHTQVKNTHFFNGCNCDLSYQIANEPWLIEADFDKKEVKILNKNQ